MDEEEDLKNFEKMFPSPPKTKPGYYSESKNNNGMGEDSMAENNLLNDNSQPRSTNLLADSKKVDNSNKNMDYIPEEGGSNKSRRRYLVRSFKRKSRKSRKSKKSKKRKHLKKRTTRSR